MENNNKIIINCRHQNFLRKKNSTDKNLWFHRMQISCLNEEQTQSGKTSGSGLCYRIVIH